MKVTKYDVLWGYIAQIFSMGVNFVVLAVTLKFLSPSILGIWYVFLAVGSLVVLLDFGFQGSFTRNVTYAFGGAVNLLKEGLDDSPSTGSPNYPLIKSLLRSMKAFYGWASLIMLVVLGVFGSLYILYISSSLENSEPILIAWMVYALAVSLDFCFSYYRPLLLGRGLIKENNILIIVTRLVYIIVVLIGFKYQYGILSLALATFASAIVNRACGHFFFSKGGIRKILKKSSYSNQNLFPVIRYNASKVGLAELAIFFTTQGNIFLASWFLPLHVVGQYGLTMQVVLLISRISQIYFQTYMPYFTHLQIRGKVHRIRQVFGESLFAMTFIYVSAACIVLLFGNQLLLLIHSQTYFLSTLVFFVMLLVYFLDANHVLPMLLLTTKNKITYLYASLFSGCSIAALSAFFLIVLNWGVYGLVLSTGIVQLLYHNWKWPLEVSKDLKISYIQFYKIGFLSFKEKVRNTILSYR